MSGEIDDLEEFAERVTKRPNYVRRDHGGGNVKASNVHAPVGFGHRSEAARRPQAQPSPKDDPEDIQAAAKPPAPPILVPAPSEIIAIIRRHQDVTDVFRMMKDRLGLTNEFCDNVGGLTKGHTDKMLGPTQAKAWGPTTFDLLCELFAIEFHVHADLAAAQRMADVWEGRKRAIEIGENSRISRKLIDKAKPHVLQASGKHANTARNAMLSPEHKSKIARKAARARWRKPRRATVSPSPCAKA